MQITTSLTLLCAVALLAPRARADDAVQRRLEQAVAETRALHEAAQDVAPEVAGRWCPVPIVPEDRAPPDGQQMVFPRRYPLIAHLDRYRAARPASTRYGLGPELAPDPWTDDAAPALLALLRHEDPALRGLAAEALGALERPEDALALAALLADVATSAPALAHNRLEVSIRQPPAISDELPYFGRSWQPRTVALYARLALQLVTGETLTATTFPAWRARTGEAGHALWSWERRLARAVRASPAGGDSAAALARITDELAAQPAEVEAKVRLLAVHPSAGGPDLCEPQQSYWARYDSTRLPRERLLELVEGQRLWADVEWSNDRYTRLVERIALSAELHLRREDAARLLRCAQTSGRELWWSARAAVLIGAARLLPPAAAGQLDEPLTRDGVLRSGLRDPDVFVSGYAAVALCATALDANWPLLHDHLLAEPDGQGYPDRRTLVLRALSEAPLTAVKRRCLRELLVDPRLATAWTGGEHRGMGRDQVRRAAAAALAAHAGRAVVSAAELEALDDPARAIELLPALRARVEEILR